MKNFIYFLLLAFIVPALFVSCEKGSEDLTTNEIGIDPAKDLDGLNRVLQMKGYFIDDEFPKSTSLPGYPFIEGAPDSIELSESGSLYIPFTIKDLSFAKVCAINMQVVGALGYWSVPVLSDGVNSSNFYIEFSVPRFVKSSPFSIVFNAKICSGSQSFITKNDTTAMTFYPTLPCGDSLVGHQGLTIRRFSLGNKKGLVKVRCYTGTIKNRIDIKYNGKYIRSSGTILASNRYPNYLSDGFITTNSTGFKDFEFTHDPNSVGSPKDLELYVLGNSGDIADGWKAIVFCPE